MNAMRFHCYWMASAFLHRSKSSSFVPSAQSIRQTTMSMSHSIEQSFLEKLDSESVFLLDGGTGEELFRRGVPDDRKIWSATAIVHEKFHATMKEVHKSFLKAGAHAITTNSYGITPGVGFKSDEIRRYCATAGRLARQVADSDSSLPSYVLGSLGPLVESYRPDLIREHNDGVSIYKMMIESLSPFVDAFLGETLSSVEEAMQPVEALSQFNEENGESRKILVSLTLQSDGKVRSGESVDMALPRILNFADQKNVKVLAILFNCCEPESISLALESIQLTTRELLKRNVCLLGAYANRLTPVAPDWSLEESDAAQPMRDDLSPSRYCTEFAKHWVKDGNVRIVGGCCGMTPDHIAALHGALVEK